MTDILYTAKEVLKKLKDNNLVTFKKASFSEAVRIGVIPFRQEDGIKSKLYHYQDVADAIKNAGIGSPPTTTEKLDKIAPPTQGQSKQEYAEQVIAELGEKPTLTDANIYKTLYAGKLEKLKYEKESGLVIARDEVESKAFSVSRAIRDKILTIPERMSNELATIDNAHQIKELLYKEFNILLEGFSEESFV